MIHLSLIFLEIFANFLFRVLISIYFYFFYERYLIKFYYSDFVSQFSCQTLRKNYYIFSTNFLLMSWWWNPIVSDSKPRALGKFRFRSAECGGHSHASLGCVQVIYYEIKSYMHRGLARYCHISSLGFFRNTMFSSWVLSLTVSSM